MTHSSQPLDYLWWLLSRASGIVALVLISLSVMMGLAMTTKVLPRPGLKRTVMKLHEHVALSAILAIATHGLSLLGDQWLKPGVEGIMVPFTMSYRPQFTGVGILGGYIALLLGPSFYLRRHIGARRWRQLHRLIALTWVAAAVHTLGAGTDSGRVWLLALVIATGIPIVYLGVLRLLSREPTGRAGGGSSYASSSNACSRGITITPSAGYTIDSCCSSQRTR